MIRARVIGNQSLMAALFGLLVAGPSITACTLQQTAPNLSSSYQPADSNELSKMREAGGRGTNLALATKCGGVQKAIAASRQSAVSAQDGAKSKWDYERLLTNAYDLEMRRGSADATRCDAVRTNPLSADLFPPSPDVSKMNRRQRERYNAEVKELKTQRARREASAAAEVQARSVEDDRQEQIARQSEQQERLIRLQAGLQLQQQLQQQEFQNQVNQQQNMNNLQQYYQNRASPHPFINCNSFATGLGSVNTTCH